MSMLDQTWFSYIERPSRYLGNEIQSIRKDPGTVNVSVALAFPDVYEVGMSHLGLKILYQILNRIEWLVSERVFCPWTDLEQELRKRDIPLTSLESGRPLSAFDILGFSLQHELSFSNVLTMLDLSGIPFLSEDRKSPFPLVIAGGPACFNPEPVAPLFDAMLIGDGEESVLELCRRVRRAKERKVSNKTDLLSELMGVEGLYLPSFYKVSYHSDGTVDSVKPSISELGRVKKALIPDLNHYPVPTDQIVPFTELIHDRLVVEIARGCTRGCRFCQAGMIYRPVRERDPRKIIEGACEAISSTGFDDLSLLSLSSGDYCSIGPLLKTLMDRLSALKVAVSFPSLRVDSLDPQWLEEIKRVRKTGFTLAPEAGNDRMRRIINKGLTDDDILRSVREVYKAGWNLIKLYFMVGLPGETEEDVKDIIRLSMAVLSAAKGKRANLNISLALFVPKSHTPFMWVPQISPEEGKRRMDIIQKAFQRNRRVRVKWNQPDMSWLEGVFSRGDRRLSEVLIEAWRMGARYDAWGEHYRREIWQDAFNRAGLDPAFYLYRARAWDETLPWDHIDSGVEKAFLRKEYQRALEEKTTPDCRRKCHECGVCDHREVDPVLFRDWMPAPEEKGSRDDRITSVPRIYRVTFTKTEQARYLSHLELVRLFIRALRRADVNLIYSQGFHPKPKLSFSSALPVGTESIHEILFLHCLQDFPDTLAKESLQRQLPTGLKILSIEDITGAKNRGKLVETHYMITLDGIGNNQRALEDFMESENCPVTKWGPKGERVVDARKAVAYLGLVTSDCLKLVISHTGGPELKPTEIIKKVFDLDICHLEKIKILKTREVMR